MRFVDEVRVTVASGQGGNGCMSFLRERFMPRGGPNGGNGGQGGAIIFEATRQRNTLVDYRWNKVYRAGNGQKGQSRDMTGAGGEDLVLYVPVGTELRNPTTGDLIADLAVEGDRWIVEGGRGGRGNTSFKTSTNRTPRQFTEGRPGQEITLLLELKLIADVGLLGFPNAGKSTFISRVSAAKPKIADYPFTTLVPNLGVVRLTEGQSFVIADIPGLIEGAADGAGLGHQFLKHVERCGCYLHLVAISDHDETSPLHRFRALNEELRRYDDAVANRPQIVVLTKTDLMPDDEVEALRADLEREIGTSVHAVSSVRGDGLQDVVGRTWKLLQARRAAEVEAGEGPRPAVTRRASPFGDSLPSQDHDSYEDADWGDDDWEEDGDWDGDEE